MVNHEFQTKVLRTGMGFDFKNQNLNYYYYFDKN